MTLTIKLEVFGVERLNRRLIFRIVLAGVSDNDADTKTMKTYICREIWVL